MFKLRQLFLEQENGGESGGGAGGASGDGEQGGQGGQGGNDLAKTVAQLQEENERMRSKMDELLGETKKAKQLKREAEEKAKLEAEEKARQAGDYEQLFKSAEEKAKTLEEQLNSLRTGIAQEKTNNSVLSIAKDLADGDDAENLAMLIANRLKFHDGEIKVLNDKGELTVSSIEDFKAEIKSTPRFKSLLRGSQASGGSANGNRASSSTTKIVSRSEFDAMNHVQRSKFVKDGGKVT